MLANRQTHAEVLDVSQKAPLYLEKTSTLLATPASTFISPESSQLWITYEQLLLSCLRAGDDRSAHLCLERLIKRFGSSNERVMGLKGIYQEAVAKGVEPLEQLLTEYDKTLSKNPTNTSIAKRRITILRTLNKPYDAIKSLVQLLDLSPIDAEAWAELSDLYLSLSMYQQAIYCLEEVLLLSPNAWNIHAHVGEILYISSALGAGIAEQNSRVMLYDALRRYCRCVELCDGYLRGYYGLKKTSDKLLEIHKQNRILDTSDPKMPSIKVVRQLNETARSRMLEIVHKRPPGTDESEIIAAKNLLDAHTYISTE